VVLRIGSAAAWRADRIEPARRNAEHVDLDYLRFETMSEATISVAQVRRLRDANFPGSACAALGFAELATMTALGSAKQRAEKLGRLAPDVLRAYVQLLRPERVVPSEHLSACADLQAEFIGSDRFRELTAALLGAG
jgi:hypothetical protein